MAAVIIPIFTAVLKPRRPQTEWEVCSVSFGGSGCPLVCFWRCRILPLITGGEFVLLEWVQPVKSEIIVLSVPRVCCDGQPSPGLGRGLLALCAGAMEEQFNKTGREECGEGRGRGHAQPASLLCAALNQTRPFSPVHLPRGTQIAILTLNSYPKSTRNRVLAPTPSVLLFNQLLSI